MDSVEIDLIVKAIVEGFEKVESNFDNVREAEDKVTDANKESSRSWVELDSVMDVAGKTLDAIGQVYQATVAKALDYADTVRDLTAATGLSADEASRLIQVSDDLGVSQGTIQQSLRALLDNGIQPTTENLAKLADEYNAIKDPAERARFAMEKGGRAGLELAKIFEAGGSKIREMSGEVSDSLIVTEDFAYQARQADIAIDNLGDTVDGAAIQLGQKFTPAVAKAAAATDKFISGQLLAMEAADLGAVGWEETSGIYQKTALGLETDAEVVAYFIQKIEMFRAAKEADIAAIEHWRDESDKAATITEAWSQGIAAGAGVLDDLGDAASTAADEQAKLRDKLSEISVVLAGPVKKEQDEYYQRQKDVGAEIVATKDKITELEGKSYLTADQQSQLDGLKTQLGDLQTQYGANADAHEEAKKRIVFDLLEQRLAVDGFSEAELKLLTDVGEKWGIFDEQTAGALRSIDGALAEFNEGEVNNTIVKLGTIFGFPDEKVYKIGVQYSGPDPAAGDFGLPGGIGTPEVGPDDVKPKSGGFARGADFIVPPGFPNDSYPMWVESGERVQVTPRGKVGDGGGVNITINNTISSKLDVEVVARRMQQIIESIYSFQA